MAGPPTRANASPNDGRIQRGRRTRIALLAATRQLVRAGHFRPGSAAILAAAGEHNYGRVPASLGDQRSIRALLETALPDVIDDVARQILGGRALELPKTDRARLARAVLFGDSGPHDKAQPRSEEPGHLPI